MKVLKQISTGLVVHEDFTLSSLSPILSVDASLTKGSDYVEFKNGGIYMDASFYDALVFEVDNTYYPTIAGDMGGIKLKRGMEDQELYEYHNPSDDIGSIPNVRVVKHNNKFQGYGSNDGITWLDRGYIIFAGVEFIGVYSFGDTLYRLNSIKAYKGLEVVIYSLLPDWTVEVYKDGAPVLSKKSESDRVSLVLPYYPYTCTVRVKDELDVLVGEHILNDVWGGDEYSVSCNVTIYDKADLPLEVMEARHLGELVEGKLEERFRVHNNDDVPVTITLSVADYSPFGSWVQFLEDIAGDMGSSFKKTLTFTIPAHGDVYFWTYITRPISADTTYDYKKNECLYYLVCE